MDNNALNPELLQLLSQYFATRGDFLAQVIRADFRTLPQHQLAPGTTSNGHGLNGHGLNGHGSNGNGSNGHGSNGHSINRNGINGNGISSNGHAIYYNGHANGNSHANGNGHAIRGDRNGNHGTAPSFQNNGYAGAGSLGNTAPSPNAAGAALAGSPSLSSSPHYTHGHGINHGHGASHELSHGTGRTATPAVPTAAPAAASPRGTYDDVMATMVNLIVEKTGFPQESIQPEARLLDDLNLDSIKAGEVVAATAKAYEVTGELDPATLANATLAEVTLAISDTMPGGGAPSQPEATASQAIETDIAQMLLDLVEESTGFPQSSIDMNMRLLDDLNLDSIKAADLVARAAKQLEIDGELDPATLANATLSDVVATLEEASIGTPAIPVAVQEVKPALPNPQPTTPALSKWVRNFAVDYVEAPAPKQEGEDWSQAQVRLVADAVDLPLVELLAAQIAALGGEVMTSTFAETLAEADSKPGSHTHIIAVLPRPTEVELDLAPLPLAAMTERLKTVTQFADATKDACLAYVQFGGGYFGTTGETAPIPESCCAAAFARSLHLERPSLRVRVIDLNLDLSDEQSAELVLAELAGSESIVTAGYDADQVRRLPQSSLQQPVAYAPRGQDWSSEDVILVTGGAKGITAECALAIAQSTGAKMALVGRSSAPEPGTSPNEISKTLERYHQEELNVVYYSCDIADPAAVNDLVQTISTDLGPISGIIHGAGLNTPRRVEQVSLDSAQAEASPKLLGAYNLLKALADEPPKLFLAFTSIIGVTGMPGNSWYGFANESLNLLLRCFTKLHPATQTVSLAYSVWDEVGMGARMGSVKNLERMGIGAISPKEGIERCVKLFHHDPSIQQVVIAAPLGGLDTWSPLPTIETDELRFIERINYLEPGVELTVRTQLTLERDLYVKDHIWRGSYLFPTVFGLEAMAQAAAVVVGEAEPTIARLENISLRRPVVVNPDSGVEIEIHAEVAERNADGERAIAVEIRTEQTGFKIAHFAATLVLGARATRETLKHKLGKALAIAPKRDLYGSLLFQGELFQQLDGAFSLSREQSLLESHAHTSADLAETGFPQGNGSSLLLGDPYFRDVLLQSMQLNIPQDICLPVEIERIDLCQNPVPAEGRRIITAILNERVDREYICEVIATDEAGNVVEHLQGYRLRILEEHPENPSAAELELPEQRDQMALQRALGQACQQLGVVAPEIALGYAPALGSQTKKKRRQVEKGIAARAIAQMLNLDPEAKVPDFTIRSHRSGQPYLSGSAFEALEAAPSLSISHDDHYCICSIAATPQGCDIESIEHRSAEDWVGLLSQARSELVDQLVASCGDRDVAGTRIWSSLEALQKACNGIKAQLHVERQDGDAVLFKAESDEGDRYVLTLPIQLTRYPQRMLALVVEVAQGGLTPVTLTDLTQDEHVDPYGIIRPGEHRTRITDDGPQSQPVYEKRFPVTFKEGCSISRKATVSQYISWVGKIRELPMRSMADRMIPDFLSGEFGMVTNSVSLRLLGEATTYDTIQARCWLGNLVNSSFATYIEFCKVLPDGDLERVAMAEVNATWVRLLSYGIPSPEPMPDYLTDYMEQFTAKSPATIDLKEAPTDTLPALSSSLAEMEAGALQYQSLQTPYGDLMLTEVFQTTLEEANLVGNVYYGNYFIWQGRVIDLFLYSLAPQYFRVSTAQGEVIPLYSHMTYMREAMPFDRVRVHLYLQRVTECGAVFNFEFFRETPHEGQEKLHTGKQEVIWANRQSDGTPVPAPWPEAIRTALLNQRNSASSNLSLPGRI